MRTICSELDGLPLAIELAASRAPSLALVDIARRLDDRFSLFRSTRPDEDRHRTLRAVVDWSYELLTPIDRALFNRLCVFGDSFTLEAAEAVVADEQVPVDYVLDGLSRLVDKSIVQIVATERGTRYRLLDTLRSYGRARLRRGRNATTTAERRLLDWAMAHHRPGSKPTCGPSARTRHSPRSFPTAGTCARRSNGRSPPADPSTPCGSSPRCPSTFPPSASGSSTS